MYSKQPAHNFIIGYEGGGVRLRHRRNRLGNAETICGLTRKHFYRQEAVTKSPNFKEEVKKAVPEEIETFLKNSKEQVQ